jgi:hypothetical protein
MFDELMSNDAVEITTVCTEFVCGRAGQQPTVWKKGMKRTEEA